MQKKFRIIDQIGLHARPATSLVNEAAKFASESKLIYKNHNANLKSIMGVMSMGLRTGEEFSIECTGHDATEAMLAISKAISVSAIAEVIE